VQYVQGTRDYVPYYAVKVKEPVNLRDVMEFIKSDNAQTKVQTQGGEKMDYFPTKKFTVPVDREQVLRRGVVPPADSAKIVGSIDFEISGNYLLKADLMILDLVAFNDWTRPIYFAVTVGDENYMNLQEYFQLEGLAYRLVPVRTPGGTDGQTGRVATGEMYDNMMNKFRWGNMSDPRVYLNQNNQNMAMNFRNNFARLAESLLAEGKRDSALKALDRCLEVMPDETVPYNLFILRIADTYYDCARYKAGEGAALPVAPGRENAAQSAAHAVAMGNAIVQRLGEITEDDLRYYLSLKGTKYFKGIERDLQQGMAILQELQRLARNAGQDTLASGLQERFSALEKKYYN
jgi:hypothetical protein